MITAIHEQKGNSRTELNSEQLEQVAGGFSWEDILDFFLTGAQGVRD